MPAAAGMPLSAPLCCKDADAGKARIATASKEKNARPRRDAGWTSVGNMMIVRTLRPEPRPCTLNHSDIIFYHRELVNIVHVDEFRDDLDVLLRWRRSACGNRRQVRLL